jgi:DNA polymerase III alpha subunit
MIKFANCNCKVEKGKFDINDIPLDCSAVWKLISSGHTVGIFQLEKNLGQDWAKRVRPDSIEELAALTALIRPGPLEAGMTKDYIDIKFGRKKHSYLHPSLEPILEPTYGCLVYQEQAIRIATDIAGLSPESADELRKAIGKKLPELMAKVKEKFVKGVQEHSQIGLGIAEEIFGWIEKCQRYSFNKSHAISYGMIAYQTAWLKCHFPHEFFTSYLTYSQYKGDPKEEIYKLIQDARLFNVNILPPDIRRGNVHFQITQSPQKGIVFGLAHIRGVGTSAIEKIVTAVSTTSGMDPLDEAVMHHGGSASCAAKTATVELIPSGATKQSPRLETWANFLAAVPVFHRNVGIALIKSGACDCYGMDRSEMVRELEVILGTTLRDSTGKKIEVKGLTNKEKIYFFDQLNEGSMNTREILSQMAQSPGNKIKTIGQMLKRELVEATIEYLDQAAVAFDGIIDGDSKFVYTSADEKQIWFDSLKNRTKKELETLILQNGYQDTVIKPPCSSDARRKIIASKAEILEKPLKNTNTISAVAEKHFLGIALSCSPADDADDSLATHTCLEIAKASNSEAIVVCAIIDSVKHTKTKRGKNPGQPMCFLTISDSTYSIDHAVVFPKAFESLKVFCKDDLICLIYGEKKNGSFIIEDIQKLI